MTNTQIAQIDYFKNPIQIIFYDEKINNWSCGIGYKNKIINLVQGNVINITDLYKPSVLEEYPQPYIILNKWINLSEIMLGDEYYER